MITILQILYGLLSISFLVATPYCLTYYPIAQLLVLILLTLLTAFIIGRFIYDIITNNNYNA